MGYALSLEFRIYSDHQQFFLVDNPARKRKTYDFFILLREKEPGRGGCQQRKALCSSPGFAVHRIERPLHYGHDGSYIPCVANEDPRTCHRAPGSFASGPRT